MAHLIRNGRNVADPWRLCDRADQLRDALKQQQTAQLLVALPLWTECRSAVTLSPIQAGVLLQGDDDPAVIAGDLGRLRLIAVHFSRFTDGRGYSLARLLRGRFGYRGELRAVGDVLHDQLYYLMRVGFDAFALRDDQDVEAALSAFASFSTTYQAAADEPLPLFRRRLVAA